MKNIYRILFFAACCSLSFTNVQADLIAYWNQNSNSLPGGGFGFEVGDFPQSADSGSGTIELVNFDATTTGSEYTKIDSFAGTTLNALFSDSSGGSLSIIGSGNNGMSVVIQVDTTGFEDIIVSWAQRGTSTGFNSREFSYSTDGMNFTSVGTDSGILTSSWVTETYDLSTVSAIDNQSSVFFRITVNGASSTNGNNRFDNIQVNGTPTGGGPDTTPPAISLLSPSDDALSVPVNTDLVVTFDEAVQAGSGNITIHLLSNGSLVETIGVGSGSVSVVGSTVTINPTASLATNTDYYVNIATGGILDTVGNPFAGIADNSTWNFTTASAPPLVEATATNEPFALGRILPGGDNGPFEYYAEGNGQGAFACFSVASFSFTNIDFALSGASTIDGIVTAELTLTHNDRTFSAGSSVEFFLTTDSYNSNFSALAFNAGILNGIDNSDFTFNPVSLGTFPYTPESGGVEDTFSLNLSGVESDVLAALQAGGEFSIIIAAVGAPDAVTFSGLNNSFDPGNPRLKLDVTETTGVDNTNPQIASLSPADDSIGVLVNADLAVNCNELVQKGTGNITIRRANDDSVVEIIDVTTSAVTVNLGTVTINPSANLALATEYYVLIDAGAIEDVSGNDFAGISSTAAWSFTTTTPAIDNVGPFTISENDLSGTVVGDLNNAVGGSEGFAYAVLSGDSAPSMMKATSDSGYNVIPLFTAGDTFTGATGAYNSNSAGNYSPIGIFDGLGAFELDANTVRVFMNHETHADQGYAYQLGNGTSLIGARISYFDIDKASRTVIDAGIAYDTVYDRSGAIVTNPGQINEAGNPINGFDRLCSSSLYEPNEFGANRGIVDRIYFAGEETAKTFGHPHGGTEWALDVANGDLHAVPAMGRGSWENVCQLDTGTTTHVAFALGDDLESSPLYLYIGEKGKNIDGLPATDFLSRNGLAFGKLYVWKATNGDTTPQQFLGTGSTRPGTFVEIAARVPANAGTPNHDALGYRDGTLMRSTADGLGAFSFSRPEDLATDPSDGSRFVFASTGRSNLFPLDKWGVMYTIDVDFTNITLPTAIIDILYDCDDVGGGQFASPELGLRNPDNLDFSDDGFIYVQEDRAGGATNEFANSGEESSIWKLDPTTGSITRIAQMCRDVVLPLGSTDPSASDLGNWESSGILDVSSLFGEAGGTLHLFNVQAHSITNGLISSLDLVQGAQFCLLEKTDNGSAFRINPNSGVITINDTNAIEQSKQSQYHLRIHAYDNVSHVFDTVVVNVSDTSITNPASIRAATFNVSMSEFAGGLINETSTLTSTHVQNIAEIIQINNPDIILINEFDFDADGKALRNFLDNYLGIGQNGQAPVYYGYHYLAPSNTGIHSGFDLDNNGIVDDTPGDQSYGDDAFGFGQYEGQFGMVLLSKYPIDQANVRTFQQFLWKDMPTNLLPPDPNDSDGDLDTTHYYNAAERDVFRLSSKSHWDIPVNVGSSTIHVLCAHPTPPAFDDGTEDFIGPITIVDENGRRNHDEIRFWADYINGANYIYDDAEFAAAGDTTPTNPSGGFTGGEKFVILGDYNADPDEGDSTADAALQFTAEPLINTIVPTGVGGPDPSDTADFVGGLRVDYALPSANLTASNAVVYWPNPEGITSVSDHRLVRVEIDIPILEQDINNYYQSADGLTGAALQAALKDIIDEHQVISYADVKEVMQVIDESAADSTQLRLIYSNATLPKSAFNGNGSSDPTTWNREHVWPRSDGVGDTGPDFSDLHHLFPCQVNVNTLRSARPFDNSTGTTQSDPFAPESTADTTNGTWEPLDRDKGMVARALLYMMVRYEGMEALTTDLELNDAPVFGGVDTGILTTLRIWHQQYPPTAYEIARNNAIYQGVEINGITYAQQNRNPFIDRPEYVEAILTETVGPLPEVIPTMGEWGVIILLCLVVFIGGRELLIRQRMA